MSIGNVGCAIARLRVPCVHEEPTMIKVVDDELVAGVPYAFCHDRTPGTRNCRTLFEVRR